MWNGCSIGFPCIAILGVSIVFYLCSIVRTNQAFSIIGLINQLDLKLEICPGLTYMHIGHCKYKMKEMISREYAACMARG